jgi:hypothetical protein
VWFLPLLIIGAIVIAASRSPRAAQLALPPPATGALPPYDLLPAYAPYSLPPLALPEPAPGPIDVLDECVMTGQVPPPPVIICAIAEAESIGRDDIAEDIVRTFVAPTVQAHQYAELAQPYAARSRARAVPYERGSCAPLPASPRGSCSPRATYDRGSCAPKSRSPRAAPYQARAPMPTSPRMPRMPATPAMSPPAPRATPSPFPTTDEEIRAMLNEDPEKFFALATSPGAAVPPPPAPAADPATPGADALADQLIQTPGHASTGVVLVDPERGTEVFEVRWLRGYPIPSLPRMIDGRPVQLVVVDNLPTPQAAPESEQPVGLHPETPTGLHPEIVAQMQEDAGLHEAADQTRAIAPGSPIAGISDDAWRQFVMCLAREAPTFNSSRHVGQYRQRRERLADLDIDPAEILGSAEAQRMALDADLVDAHDHAVGGGLVDFVGRSVVIPGQAEPVTITLSGLLGVIQCAGLDGAVGWLEKSGDRKRYPHTTQVFTRTNGVY